jgi:glucose/mannose-6-phosphate isomerase
MNLDDLSLIQKIDTQNMLGEIDNLPNQLQSAWDLGQHLPLPGESRFSNVVIAGMGGSAIGADLLSAYAAPACSIPVTVHRDYRLPAFARGPQTLVVCSSHSGNTEETLSSFEAAQVNGCTVLAVTTGGQLAGKAGAANLPVWKFAHNGQPRAAVGFSFGLLLALFARLGLIPDPARDLVETVAGMKSQQEALGVNVPVVVNPAKRAAGQYMGRWVTVIASGALAPVARRWKGQINEVAKAGANFEFLPEADHNTLAGLLNPEEMLTRTMTVFLNSKADHPRNRLRSDITRQTYMLEGLNTDFYTAKGDSTLANIWTALHYGDYAAYYLAIAYGVDPTPVTALENLKAQLKAKK